jgi:hypothetical protein
MKSSYPLNLKLSHKTIYASSNLIDFCYAGQCTKIDFTHNDSIIESIDSFKYFSEILNEFPKNGGNLDTHSICLFLSTKVKSFSDIEVVIHHTRKENIQDKLIIETSGNTNYNLDKLKNIYSKSLV